MAETAQKAGLVYESPVRQRRTRQKLDKDTTLISWYGWQKARQGFEGRAEEESDEQDLFKRPA